MWIYCRAKTRDGFYPVGYDPQVIPPGEKIRVFSEINPFDQNFPLNQAQHFLVFVASVRTPHGTWLRTSSRVCPRWTSPKPRQRPVAQTPTARGFRRLCTARKRCVMRSCAFWRTGLKRWLRGRRCHPSIVWLFNHFPQIEGPFWGYTDHFQTRPHIILLEWYHWWYDNIWHI